jgi:mannose-6-phosphate isomerase-like protein (cupin superfamily)
MLAMAVIAGFRLIRPALCSRDEGRHLQHQRHQSPPGESARLGFMRAVFKADGVETNDRYSVSEWWMEPRNAGPGAHHHEHNDEVFYVLEGTASILIGDAWVDVGKGSFIRIPAGITHDFENRTDPRMGLLNFFIPGGFEEKMPAIVE